MEPLCTSSRGVLPSRFGLLRRRQRLLTWWQCNDSCVQLRNFTWAIQNPVTWLESRRYTRAFLAGQTIIEA